MSMRIAPIAVLSTLAVLSLAACSPQSPSVEVGECLDVSALGAEIEDLPTIDCATLHEGEVYLVEDLTLTGEYDETTVFDAASLLCYNAFEGFIGVPQEESTVAYYTIFPIAESWDQGEREATCIAVQSDGTGAFIKVTGSLKGSKA